MARLLRIDMSKKEVKFADVPDKYALLGGRALTSQIVADEVPPTCDPLGKFNKLVLRRGSFPAPTPLPPGACRWVARAP